MFNPCSTAYTLLVHVRYRCVGRLTLQAKLDTSLWYQGNKLLKLMEGAITYDIYITSKRKVLGLHPDRNRFSTWVQDNYSHLTDQHWIPSSPRARR